MSIRWLGVSALVGLTLGALVVGLVLLRPHVASAGGAHRHTKIAFDRFITSGPSLDYDVFVMNPDGSHRQRLTQNPAYDWAPAVSPNGRRIVFGSDRDGEDEIFVMRSDGSHKLQLTHNTASDELPSFSPDGRRIIFGSNRDGDYEIFKMRADGSDQRKLTDNSDDDFGATSRLTASGSPSTAIAMAMPRSSRCAPTAPTSTSSPATPPASTSSPPTPRMAKQIAFRSNRDGDFEIFKMRADGSHQRKLTHNTDYDSDPAYSPNGKRIAFTSDRDGDDEIFIMRADGSNQHKLTRNTVAEEFPTGVVPRLIDWASLILGQPLAWRASDESVRVVRSELRCGPDRVPSGRETGHSGGTACRS